MVGNQTIGPGYHLLNAARFVHADEPVGGRNLDRIRFVIEQDPIHAENVLILYVDGPASVCCEDVEAPVEVPDPQPSVLVPSQSRDIFIRQDSLARLPCPLPSRCARIPSKSPFA